MGRKNILVNGMHLIRSKNIEITTFLEGKNDNEQKDKGRKKTYATYEEAVDIICGRNKKRIENEIEKSLGKIPMCAHEAMLKWDVRAAV